MELFIVKWCLLISIRSCRGDLRLLVGDNEIKQTLLIFSSWAHSEPTLIPIEIVVVPASLIIYLVTYFTLKLIHLKVFYFATVSVNN